MKAYKNNLLKTIITEYEDYQIMKLNEREEAEKLRKRYSSEVAEAKIKEVREANERAKERYNANVKKAYEKEMKTYKDIQSKEFTGASITDDVKLLSVPQLKLTSSEVQLLADRYKDNNLMTRIINNYAEENKINVSISLNNSNEDRIKAIENAYSTSIKYCDDDMKMALLTEKEFEGFDNVLSGEASEG